LFKKIANTSINEINSMKIILNNTTVLKKQLSSCLLIGIFENGELTPTAKKIDLATQGHVSKLIKTGKFSAKIGQTLPLFYPAGTPFAHIILVGCGKADKLSANAFRKIMCSAIKSLPGQTPTVTCYLTELSIAKRSMAWKVKQLIEAAWDALYCFDDYKTKKEPARVLQKLIISVPKEQMKICQLAVHQGIAVAAGVLLTKNLANTPSNICTPTYLAQQAQTLAKTYSTLSVKILSEKDMKKLGMGAILAVSQGSAQEAKLICLEYKGTQKKTAPIALVGKGITFDTGGNSLKPAENMIGMKYDMCGAATVLGTFKAVAELKLPLHLVGVIAAVENMPGGSAYKPEDIIKSMSGQTIEVLNTDAEGRLVLSDALTYCERYQPKIVIDIATLTGAVVIALGTHASGLLANDEALAQALLTAGEESNDRAWQLPLWDEYQEQIKSPFADIANIGGRMAGTITAACFLSRFTQKFHWAHLDVAGTAAMMMSGSERMATGRPVPMLVQYLIDRV
jgi:leucyl aminopeptidase